MILIERENPRQPGRSHAVSSTNDVFELELFRRAIGAPAEAWCRPPQHTIPHIDLRGTARQRAFAAAEADGGAKIRVYHTTDQLAREYKRMRLEARAVAEK